MKGKPMGKRQVGTFDVICLKSKAVVATVKALNYCDALNVFFGGKDIKPGYRVVKVNV
jgi:hypothetical protein